MLKRWLWDLSRYRLGHLSVQLFFNFISSIIIRIFFNGLRSIQIKSLICHVLRIYTIPVKQNDASDYLVPNHMVISPIAFDFDKVRGATIVGIKELSQQGR